MEEQPGIYLHAPPSFSNINPQSSQSLEEYSSKTRLGEKEVLKEGWILKWGNFIKGYDQRWLVLYTDRMVYYKDSDSRSRYRGAIGLQDADVQKEDYFGFTVSNRHDTTFKFKAENEYDQHSWISAIEYAKAKLVSKSSEVEDDDDHQTFSYKDQAAVEEVVQILDEKLNTLKAFNDNFIQQAESLNWTLINLMKMSRSNKEIDAVEHFKEQSPHFMSACSEILKSATDFLQYAKMQEARWKKMLANNLEHKVVLEDMVEQMATQQSQLENLAKSNAYKDLYSTGESHFHANKEHLIPNRTSSEVNYESETCNSNKSLKECSSIEAMNERLASPVEHIRQRRCKIPYKSHHFHIKLWSIIRNSIYRDIIPLSLPVYFNEPLTMNQRLTEMFENAFLLDRAADSPDVYEQMTYISAFVIASYSAHPFRASKPFIPFLGETYECDRHADLHWKCLTECVSSEPLTIVQYCEGKEWELHQEFYISSKFKGQTVEVYPKGVSFLKIRGYLGEQEYSWERLTTIIHNVIIGQMWVTHLGKVHITNRETQDKSIIKFHQKHNVKKSFSFKVQATVKDKDNSPKFMLSGMWDTKIEAARVSPNATDILEDGGGGMVKTCMPVVLWEKDCLENSAKMYHFGLLACQMNEVEANVAPTDSRLRADVRLLEQGRSEDSMRLKLRLKQVNNLADYLPTWFSLEPGIPAYQYNGTYWSCKKKQDWSSCPNLVLAV